MILTVFPEVEWLLVHTEVPRREPVSVAHGPHCVAITLHGDILNFPGGHGSHRSLGVHLSLVLLPRGLQAQEGKNYPCVFQFPDPGFLQSAWHTR